MSSWVLTSRRRDMGSPHHRWIGSDGDKALVRAGPLARKDALCPSDFRSHILMRRHSSFSSGALPLNRSKQCDIHLPVGARDRQTAQQRNAVEGVRLAASRSYAQGQDERWLQTGYRRDTNMSREDLFLTVSGTSDPVKANVHGSERQLPERGSRMGSTDGLAKQVHRQVSAAA